MKKYISVLFLSSILVSCNWVKFPIHQNHFPKKLAIIMGAESNSGGMVPNSFALPSELGIRHKIMHLNNFTYAFEPLNIGVNNNMDHLGINCCGTHGWELELANQLDSDTHQILYNDTTYLIKYGQGGGQLWQFLVQCNPICDSTLGYIGKAYMRISAARYILDRPDVIPVIWLQIGINDNQAGLPVDAYKIQLYNHINTMRAIMRDTTPVIIAKFFGQWSTYNNAVDSVANNMGLTKVYTIDGSSTDLLDPWHYNYTGMKIMTRRFLNVVNTQRSNW